MAQTFPKGVNLVGARAQGLAEPTALTDATSKNYVDTRAFCAGGFGPPRNLKQVRMLDPLGTYPTPHNAFPSLVRRSTDGVIYAVFRSATNHSAARDGKIYIITSSDLGRTWSAPTLIIAGDATLTDARDPCISQSRDGSRLYCTYFKANASNVAGGVYFKWSTNGTGWSAEVRIEAQPYSASSAPAVQLATGRIIVPFYGRSGAETIDSAYIAYSDNDGTSWSTARIINGTTLAANIDEPWISQKPGADNLFMTYRYGSNIGASYTDNSAGTGIAGWSTAAAITIGTGRPSNVWLSDNTAMVHYRNGGNVRFLARMSDSPEFASSWGKPYVVRNCQGAGAGSVGLWTYSQAIEIGNGVCLALFAEENSTATTSKLFATTFARGGGNTPLGPIPDNWSAVASLYDRTEYAMDMLGGRGSWPLVPPDLQVIAGALTAIEMPGNADINVLSSASADNVPDRAIVETGIEDVDIEADFYGSVQSGYAIIFRVVDASNFLMFTVETTFTNLRLYKVVAGVATQLGTIAGIAPADSWQTLKVSVRGSLILCARNGDTNIGYQLAAGAEQTQFMTPTKHGISLNAQSGGSHFCRRLVITSFGL
jgi:hypothetical protein